jgi:xanthine dehydrogenase YagS FAD-binding subunit
MAVALAALDARVELTSLDGVREVAVTDLYRLPGQTPQLDTVVAPGELITAVVLPPPPAGGARYRKVRDRASYAFALVSVAAVLGVAEGRITTARLALGGVAPRPWRAATAETRLVGAEPTDGTFDEAIEAELAAADPLPGNEFKVGLTHRTVVAVLRGLRDEAVAS